MKTLSGAKGAKTCTALYTKPSPTAPYSAVNGNLLKFAGIFQHGTEVALMKGTQKQELKNKNPPSVQKCPNLYGPAHQAFSHRAV